MTNTDSKIETKTDAPDGGDAVSSNEEIAIKLGKRLSNARLKKKLSLNEIAEKLKIREMHLRALEKGDYKSLPEMTYALGFMRSYAQFLGLPTDRLLEDFKQSIGAPEKKVVSTEKINDLPLGRSSKLYLFCFAIIVAIGLYLSWVYYNDYVVGLQSTPNYNETSNSTDNSIGEYD